ncbi:kinase-like domain-containing protein [Apiospora marii]|uniref:EKC/KEOPS complex subunit BUD32 n=1 Tax=Apiospora marii TaxID=335849 RepID=A0ABR1RUD1_9PEZI
MDHPTNKSSGDELSDPSTAEPQVEEGAEVTSLPTNKDPVYMPIEGVQLEELEMYQEDGFHPVHLGDKLYNDDYEVVAKLGDGGFGTVWLCMEGPEADGHTVWRAVKVIAACASQKENPELRIIDDLRNEGITRSQWEEAGILLPITHFYVKGPNGEHLCLVFPVMGPSLVSQMGASVDTIKDVLTQAGKSLQFLHDNGICHGDFTSDNVLLHIDDVGRISKNEMIALLEGPTHDVKMADGSEPLSPNAPRYLVQRGDITNLSPKTQTATIDFGISYQTGDPPEFVGVPARYAAPEAFFRLGNTGPTSDVWSYICMIMEIRCRAMFYNTSKRSEYVKDLQALLGPLPDSYRLAWKTELAHEGVVDDDEDNDFVSMTEEEYKRQRQDAAEQSGYADYLQGLIGAAQEHVVYQRDADYTPSPTKVTWRVPEEEVYQLADLFQKVLKYDPDERIRIGEVLQHEWFQVGKATEDGEKPAKASTTVATRTSLAGTKGGNVPKTEEKRVTAIKSTDPSKTPSNADKVRAKPRARPSRIPIATKEPLGIDSEGARVYYDQQWKDRDIGEVRERRHHPQAVAQAIARIVTQRAK